jgi:hypothetical protein
MRSVAQRESLAEAGAVTAFLPQAVPSGPSGAQFAATEDRERGALALADAGWVVARVEVTASARGRLGELVDDAIERALQARGAMAPGLAGASNFSSYRDASLGEQLFRARRTGATGIAVVIGPLRAATAPLHAIAPEDTQALAFLFSAAATLERSFVVLLDEEDRRTRAYSTTVPLAEALAPRIPPTLAPASGAEVKAPEPEPRTEPRAPEPEPAAVLRAPEPAPDTEPTPAIPRDAWRSYAVQLSTARGPQSLGSLERLFTESYVPLASMLDAGLAEPRAREVRDQFAASFAKSYSDAFATFGVTGKRPRMVLDVHEIAARIARLHGARMVRLLLVDGMRWDLAQRVQQSLSTRLSRATLTESMLLWSALPTTTWRQLETIARGTEALRAPAQLDEDDEPLRGRNAEYVRRMRVGPREIYKLDIVESHLQTARPGVIQELPTLADETAEVLAHHVEGLAARTLLFVFGDHGFAVDRRGVASQGGALPEEVLVGAFAVLVGDVH